MYSKSLLSSILLLAAVASAQDAQPVLPNANGVQAGAPPVAGASPTAPPVSGAPATGPNAPAVAPASADSRNMNSVQAVKVSNMNGSLTYSPEEIVAAPGTLVQFQFYPKVSSGREVRSERVWKRADTVIRAIP
jgi:hypothetical protein